MHGGWYASGMGLGASSGLQSGFSSGSLAGSVVPHSQSYHLMVSSIIFTIYLRLNRNLFASILRIHKSNQTIYFSFCLKKFRERLGEETMRDGIISI